MTQPTIAQRKMQKEREPAYFTRAVATASVDDGDDAMLLRQAAII